MSISFEDRLDVQLPPLTSFMFFDVSATYYYSPVTNLSCRYKELRLPWGGGGVRSLNPEKFLKNVPINVENFPKIIPMNPEMPKNSPINEFL